MIDRERLAALAAEEPSRSGVYRNRFATPRHGLGAFLRWQWDTRGRFPRHQSFPLQQPDARRLANPGPHPQLTWIGHSTFLFQHRGWNLIPDPVFS